ncbi:MAG: FAD:protein FMN transferase [Planctomycetaceae bacterium]|nr:FAD:protein FMN transferase [Planctomycetaceae bacterium]
MTPNRLSSEKKSPESSKSSPIMFWGRIIIGILLVLFVIWHFVIPSLFVSRYLETIGETMGGIRYCVRVSGNVPVFSNDEAGWGKTKTAIQEELDRIDRMMSTFKATSEVTKFNRFASTDWFPVSDEIVKLVKLSQETAPIVENKFDITVGPFVDLWGFGPKKKTLAAVPSPADLAEIKMTTGLEKLEYRVSPPALRKTVPELRIDLSGVAKGYAVDCVAQLLEQRGHQNYMIEIGGETRTRGTKKDGHPWVIGIQEPFPVSLDEKPTIFQKVDLKNHAMATSGDAQSHVEIDGKRYTHIIDPVTGNALPTSLWGTGLDAENEGEQVGSVSVIAETCARADALATGFFLTGAIKGVDRGIQIADQQQLAIMYLIRTGDEKNPVRAVMSAEYQKNYAPSVN